MFSFLLWVITGKNLGAEYNDEFHALVFDRKIDRDSWVDLSMEKWPNENFHWSELDGKFLIQVAKNFSMDNTEFF